MDTPHWQHIPVGIVVACQCSRLHMSKLPVRHYYGNYCSGRTAMASMDFQVFVPLVLFEFLDTARMDHQSNQVDKCTWAHDVQRDKWPNCHKFQRMDRRICISHKSNDRYNLHWFRIRDDSLYPDHMDCLRSLANSSMLRPHFVLGIQHLSHMAMDGMALLLVHAVRLILVINQFI